MEPNPRKVFLQMFGEGDTPEERSAIGRQTASLLDLVLDGTKSLQRNLGSKDKIVLDGYLESVREIERRTQRAEAKDFDAVRGAHDRYLAALVRDATFAHSPVVVKALDEILGLSRIARQSISQAIGLLVSLLHEGFKARAVRCKSG